MGNGNKENNGNNFGFPPKWAFGLFSIINIIVILYVGVILYLFRSDPMPIAHYRILLALVFMGLSSTVGLLFAGWAKIDGNLGRGFKITLGGAGVVWIAALIVFVKIWPEESVIAERAINENLGIFLKQLSKNDHTISYTDWKKKLKNLQKYFNENEEFQLEQILTSVYYKGTNEEDKKLSNPIIQSLFVYLDKGIILKFQRIQGEKSGTADIYHRPAPTTPNAQVKSVLLVKENGTSVRAYTNSSGTWWQAVESEPVDCLIVALYEEDLQYGDFWTIDLKKYLKDGSAKIDIGILALKKSINRKRISFWKVQRSPLFADSEGIPISFEKFDITGTENLEHPLIEDFQQWMQILDNKKYITQSPNPGSSQQGALEILNNIHDKLSSQGINTFEALSKCQDFKSKFLFQTESIQDPVIIAFEWN